MRHRRKSGDQFLRLVRKRAKPKAHIYPTGMAVGGSSSTSGGAGIDVIGLDWQYSLYDNLTETATARAAETKVRSVKVHNLTATNEDRQRVDKYVTLYGLISSMPKLPEGHMMHVDAETSSEAKKIVNLLRQFDVPVPQIFSTGGDTLVLKWDRGETAHYLTVIGSEFSQLDLHKLSKMTSEDDIDFNDDDQRRNWLDGIGAVPLSSSAGLDEV